VRCSEKAWKNDLPAGSRVGPVAGVAEFDEFAGEEFEVGYGCICCELNLKIQMNYWDRNIINAYSKKVSLLSEK